MVGATAHSMTQYLLQVRLPGQDGADDGGGQQLCEVHVVLGAHRLRERFNTSVIRCLGAGACKTKKAS
jgi:hypothetical protein